MKYDIALLPKEIETLKALRKEWTPDKFLVGKFACNQRGDEVDPRDETAVNWCVQGYLCKLMNIRPVMEFFNTPLRGALNKRAEGLFPTLGTKRAKPVSMDGWDAWPTTIADVNNDLGHGAVLEIIDDLLEHPQRLAGK